MALRGNGTIPAVYSARLRLAKHAGMKIMELVEKNIRPRDIMTQAAFHNAEAIDMALGCSTNTMLHLPAIAHECGIQLSFDMANEISDHTPNLCHLAPAGNTYMEDLERAGGVYAVMAELAKKDLLDTRLLTCTGKTMAENLQGVVNRDPEIIRPIDDPYTNDRRHRRAQGQPGPRRLRGEAVRRGPGDDGPHRAPPGCSTARTRPSQAIYAGKIVAGDVVVIRYEGPKGGPGMREMLNPTSAICGHGPGQGRGPHHRRPLLRRHPRAPPSATSPPRPPAAAPSAWWRRATSSPSTSRSTPSSCWWTTIHLAQPQGQVGLPRAQDQDRLSGPLCQDGSPPPTRARFWSKNRCGPLRPVYALGTSPRVGGKRCSA